jgi:four helix bundle suffix protein
MIGLIKVTSYLLKRQLQYLEKDFVENGGIRERMAKARLSHRKSR